MTKPTYNEDNIQNLQYPDSVRHRPTMYIGDTGNDGLFTILREALDNGLDEALAGRATVVAVHIEREGKHGYRFTAIDNGSGIPVGMKTLKDGLSGATVQMPTIQVALGVPHSSGKFNDDAYKTSRGVHGLGVKCTNALSTEMICHTKYEGKWYAIEFSKGVCTKKLYSTKAPINPFTGKPLHGGTMLEFVPDMTIFKGAVLDVPTIESWCELSSYFTPNVTIHLSTFGKTSTHHAPNGISEYLDTQLSKYSLQPMEDAPYFISHSSLVDSAIAFTNSPDTRIVAFTNGLHNSGGGGHLNTLHNALYTALSGMASKKQEFTVADVKLGIVGIVNAKLSSPEFNSQTKERLTDARCKDMQPIITDEMVAFFKKNRSLAAALIDRAVRVAEARKNNNALKTLAKALKGHRDTGLPVDKYTAAKSSVPPEHRRLFLMEGDSAKGTAKKARTAADGLLALRGKILNVIKATDEKSLVSNEIPMIISALGIDLKSDNPFGKLQYGRVVFLTDSDSDGYHIAALLIAFFYKYTPELIERGIIWIARAPEYYSQHGSQLSFGNTQSEVHAKNAAQGFPKSTQVHHLKGWGECPVAVLRVIAFSADSPMYQLMPSDEGGQAEFLRHMGDDVNSRRELVGVEEWVAANTDEEPVEGKPAPKARPAESRAEGIKRPAKAKTPAAKWKTTASRATASKARPASSRRAGK